MPTRLDFSQINGLTGSLSDLESEISIEESRIDTILDGATSSLDSFGEVSSEISTLDSTIDNILAGSSASMDSFSEVTTKINSLETKINTLGATGPTGATGPQGATGSTGATGATGPESANYFNYLKNHYQTFHENTGLSGTSFTQALFANTLCAFPIQIKKAVTVQSMRYANIGSAAGNSVWGLYDSGSDGSPNNRLFQTSAFNNGLASTIQTYTLPSNQTLQPGIYWIVYNSSSAPTIRCFQVVNVTVNIIGETNGGMFNGPQSFLNRAFNYTGSLPNPFGSWSVSTLSTVAPPYVYFYIV
jgi:hypothetical protein